MYPRLDQLLPLEKIPNELEDIREALVAVFDDIFVKNLIVGKSYEGDSGVYTFSLISDDLGINLPIAEDLRLIFNPNNSGETEIPIYFDYSWLIIKYIKNFNASSFDNSIKSVFNILLELANVDSKTVLKDAIVAFYPEASFLSDFISDFNSKYNKNVEESSLSNLSDLEKISIISDDIAILDLDIAEVIFDFFLDASLEEGLKNLKQLFAGYFENIQEKIKEIIQLQFNLSINEISLGLQFPRKWLRPVNENTLEPLPDNNFSILKFNAGRFLYSSKDGFDFVNINSLSLNKSEIAKTGLILEFSNLKIDLQNNENIHEAVVDGRPDNFKGVYVEYAAVTLPPRWFNDDEVVGGVTAKVAGYNLLIGTGGLSGTIALETQTFRNSSGTVLNYYTDYFQFVYPIQTRHKDVDNNMVITTIANDTALKSQLDNFEKTQFVFPLSLTKKGESIPSEFTNIADYYAYINTLYDDSNEANKPRLSKRIGKKGFEIWFTSFDMTFKQGSIVESNIKGGLKIPRLKDSKGNIANVEISGHLDDSGGFNVTASEQDGFEPLIIPDVLDVYIKSLEVGRESSDEPFYIGTACDIVFTNEIIKSFIGDTKITIDRMRIYSDGGFEIVGGAIAVPTSFTLNLGPVEISITGINFGAFQEEYNGVLRKYNFFGFDGGISLGNIGVEARGEGVKYFYSVDDAPAKGSPGDDNYQPAKEPHSYIKIETIEVDLTIPGTASASSATAIIKGWLSINEIEYAGGVSLKLPKLKMGGGADMRLQPKSPAFLIDAHLDIPIPIPLAATGLGITGFRGLMGFRYVAEKEAIGLHSHDDKWYDYYTYPSRGVDVKKFNGPDKTDNYTNPVSIGAGVTVGMMGASDAISLRVMVLLSIPNMLMIDGRASILSKEWGLDDSGEPPFFAFMILADNGIEVGAGVDFKLPQKSGSIIDLHVYMQAGFFWDNPSGWYLNLGTREDPISAKVLSLVEMQAFLMLSGSGIAAGARVSFDIKERFGPIGIKAWLLAEVGGFISFERPQIGGYMTVDAGARVDLFGIISVGVSFYVHFSVEAAQPFLIYAEIRVCGRIKFVFFSIRICANVKIKWEKSRRIDKTPIPPITPIVLPLPALTNQINDQAVKGVHMLTGESFELINFGKNIPNANSDLFNKAIIPLDTYVDIKFDKSLLPRDIAGIIGSYNNPPENYEDLMPPVKVIKGNELRQVKHRYKITDIGIKAAKEGSSVWVDYHPFEAVVESENRAQVDNLRIGHWQKSSKEYNAIRILATSPFSYTEQGEPGWFVPEQIGLTPSSFFCEGQPRNADCMNWLKSPLDIFYRTKTQFPYYHEHQGVFFNISQGQKSRVNGIVMNSVAKVVNEPNGFGFSQSLKFPNTSALEFKLPREAREVSLKISTDAEGVKVIYYKSYLPQGGYRVHYMPVASIDYTPEELANSNGIKYTNTEVAISKIEVYPKSADQIEVDKIYEQIEVLFNETYEELGNDLPLGADVEIPLNAAEYFRLLDELEVLQNKGCNTSPVKPTKGGIGYMQIQKDNYDKRRLEVGKTPIDEGLLESSCSPCDLHEALLNHYNDSFEDNETYDIGSFETFLNLITGCGVNKAPIVTGITFLDGNCCEEDDVLPPSNLSINSSIPYPETGEGTLDFNGGVPGEVLELEFIAILPDRGGSLIFSPTGMVSIIDTIHKTRTGIVRLDGTGKKTYNYEANGEISCSIKITSRSSTYEIPSRDKTIINYTGNEVL